MKVLQTFVSHLPDYELGEGMPRCYQELGLLLRQLSLCCSQLEITGQAPDAPDNVMRLIHDMAVSIAVLYSVDFLPNIHGNSSALADKLQLK